MLEISVNIALPPLNKSFKAVVPRPFSFFFFVWWDPCRAINTNSHIHNVFTWMAFFFFTPCWLHKYDNTIFPQKKTLWSCNCWCVGLISLSFFFSQFQFSFVLPLKLAEAGHYSRSCIHYLQPLISGRVVGCFNYLSVYFDTTTSSKSKKKRNGFWYCLKGWNNYARGLRTNLTPHHYFMRDRMLLLPCSPSYTPLHTVLQT